MQILKKYIETRLLVKIFNRYFSKLDKIFFLFLSNKYILTTIIKNDRLIILKMRKKGLSAKKCMNFFKQIIK